MELPLKNAADDGISQAVPARTVGQVLAQSQVLRVLDELERDLIGLAPVQQRIRDIAALLVIDKLRANLGLAAHNPSLHMSLPGNPGTGKTTVALRMAQILHRLGYSRQGHLVAVTRDDLGVILAGCKERMGTFFKSNPGMSCSFGPGTREVVEHCLARRPAQLHVANARNSCNAPDRARLRQASRVFHTT